MSTRGRSALVRIGLSVALALPISITPDPLPAAASEPDIAWPFVYRVGGDLYLEGEPFRFSGFNIYYANNLRNDGCTHLALGQGSELAAELEEWGPGFNVLRTWFFQNLAQTDIAEDGGVRDWSAFDHTLAAADAAGLKVIATLTDQVGECGDGGVNGFKTNAWYEFGYRDGVDFGNLVPYRDWVREVVARYRNDPRIAFWQLINEGEVKQSANAACLPGGQSFPVFRSWAADVSALVKSIDPNHLVSLGTMGGGQCGAQWTEYQELHELPAIDLCEYHDYSPNEAMPGDEFNGLAFRAQQCAAIDKPLFVGEVGITPNDLAGAQTVEARAVAFDNKLREQRALGIAGHVAWAWVVGPSRLDTFDIGAGDPIVNVLPHAPATTTERVSVSSTGTQGDDHVGTGVGDTDISGDGRFVAFATHATTLATGGDPGGPNLYIRDRARGTTELAFTTTGGAADGFSHAPALSATGRHLAFRSFAENLVPGDTNELVDVFVHDRVLDTTARVSVASDGGQMTGDSTFGVPDISADGRYVVFASQGGGLVPQVPSQGFSRLYIQDRDADADGVFDEPGAIDTRLIDVTADDSLGSGPSYRPTISSDGRWVAFMSEATNLVPDDAPACPAPPEPEQTGGPAPTEAPQPSPSGEPPSENTNCIDVFLLDRDPNGDGVIDPGVRTLALVSRTQSGTQADGDSLSPAVADDGDVTFGTFAGNLGSDGSHTVVVRDQQTGAIAVAGRAVSNNPSISADGTAVGYDSFVANGTSDAFAGIDAFVYDRATSSSRVVNLGTDGVQGDGGHVPALNRDARFVSFSSFTGTLVPDDTNALMDVFVRDLGDVPAPPSTTAVGSNVSVQPVYGPTGATPVTVTFASVTNAGVTTLAAVDTLAPPPSGFGFADSTLAWNVSTTATYAGPVTLCFTYAEGQVAEPVGHLMHFTAGAWTEVTSSHDAEANVICGSVSSLSDFAAATPDPAVVFVETSYLDTYDHGILWITELIDPTSIPRPSDFSVTIDGVSEPVTDVDYLYQGLDGSPLLASIDLTRGSAFLEISWATDAPPGADVRLFYTPGDHPLTTADGRELPGLEELGLERFGEELTLGVVDEGAGPDRLLLLLTWPIDEPLPDASDFSVSATSWAGPQAPLSLDRRASHLGATLLQLDLAESIQPTDDVLLSYTPGATPILRPDGQPLAAFTNMDVAVSLSAVSTRQTDIGTDVTVEPHDSETGAQLATVTFAEVTGSGSTSLSTTEVAPPLPTGFSVGDPPTYYDITTTAEFQGTALVCIQYGSAEYTSTDGLRLFHFQDDAWADVTTSHDPDTQTICGQVSSLSPFAVVESGYEFDGFYAPVDMPPTVNAARAGRGVPIKFSLGGDFGLGIFGSNPPTSTRVACPSEAPVDTIETTVAASAIPLSYDPVTDRYTFAWKTDRSWRGCREFTIRLLDGTTVSALFRFAP